MILLAVVIFIYGIIRGAKYLYKRKNKNQPFMFFYAAESLLVSVAVAYSIFWLLEFAGKDWIANLGVMPQRFRKLDATAIWVFITWLPQFFFRTYRHHIAEFQSAQEKLKSLFTEEWKTLNDKIYKQIVFNVDLTKSYDKKHITDLKERLDRAFSSIGVRGLVEIAPCIDHIYAVDASSPRTWWSESMLGYLAIQAAWKAKDSPPAHERKLTRVFVWNPVDIAGPLGQKLIILHCLFGFSTYVVRQAEYLKMRNDICSQKDFSPIMALPNMPQHFGLKEFVIWECEFHPLSPSNMGYRSYWNLQKANDLDREKGIDSDGQTCEHEQIKWRNYQSNEAEFYLKFVKKLLLRTREVKKSDEFSNMKEDWKKRRLPSIYRLNSTNSEELECILQRLAVDVD